MRKASENVWQMVGSGGMTRLRKQLLGLKDRGDGETMLTGVPGEMRAQRL